MSDAFVNGVASTILAGVLVFCAVVLGRVSHPANACHEDEVYAVVDTRTDHGLMWACFPKDDK